MTVSAATSLQPKTTLPLCYLSKELLQASLGEEAPRRRRTSSTTIFSLVVVAHMSTGRGKRFAGAIVGVGNVTTIALRKLW